MGAELLRQARAAGHAVVGAARQVQGEATVVADLLDRAAVDRALEAISPDVVAICSAYPHVDGCEKDPERSLRENVGTVRTLIEATRGAQTKLVFYSTDHVFDGTHNPYGESAAVNPPSVYARHKRQAEELLLARGNALVARTAWVFGAELRRKNFAYQVISRARAGEPLSVPVNQAGCPTWSGWLAHAALTLLAQGLEGLVHLSGSEPLTKAEWARLIVRELELPPLELRELPWAEAGQVAPRPARVELVSERHKLLQPPLSVLLRAQHGALTAD